MVRYGMVWYGMAWHGMVWHGMVSHYRTITSSLGDNDCVGDDSGDPKAIDGTNLGGTETL